MFGWKRYDGFVSGVVVDGDATSPPTRWWNLWSLYLWRWKVSVRFAVMREDADKGYYIGYVPKNGMATISTTRVYDMKFRMLIGREPCRFFAVDKDKREVTLNLNGFIGRSGKHLKEPEPIY